MKKASRFLLGLAQPPRSPKAIDRWSNKKQHGF
ncbi:hypothetical protein QFZ72_004577 [Bacillus sp. V2I10]|nr:hypothetical protein [Bacillus sp. V2I10]